MNEQGRIHFSSAKVSFGGERRPPRFQLFLIRTSRFAGVLRRRKVRLLAAIRVLSLSVALTTSQTSWAASVGEVHCDGAAPKLDCYVGNDRWNVEAPAVWSISVGSGNDIRFEVRPGDVAAWDRNHNHRAERAEISGFNSKEPTDSDLWFSTDLMVEPGAKVTSRWLVLGQLHPTEDPGDVGPSPAWAQELNADDVFRIVVRARAETPLRSNPAPQVLFVDPEFKRGQTYHFIYRVRYGAAQGGLDAWRDGIQIVHYSGPIGYINRNGPYFKFGIYREPAPETLVVHYKNLRFGDAVVKP
jgi:hypothetical protein